MHCCVGFLNLRWVKPDHFPFLAHSLCLSVSEEILERVRAKQEQEMDQLKKKAAEEMQKSSREELQEQLSTAGQEKTEAPEDKPLQTQTGTEEANPAGR